MNIFHQTQSKMLIPYLSFEKHQSHLPLIQPVV